MRHLAEPPRLPGRKVGLRRACQEKPDTAHHWHQGMTFGTRGRGTVVRQTQSAQELWPKAEEAMRQLTTARPPQRRTEQAFSPRCRCLGTISSIQQGKQTMHAQAVQ